MPRGAGRRRRRRGIAQTGSKTKLAACYKTKGKTKGAMRFLTKSTAKCKKGEKKVSWNQVGTQGAAGARGAVGRRSALRSGRVLRGRRLPRGLDPVRGRPRPLPRRPERGRPVGAPVGTALGNQESRAVGQHGHDVTDPGHGHEIRGDGGALRMPSTRLAGRPRHRATLPPSLNTATTGVVAGPTGVTVNPAGTVAGTPAPYVQLLACRKA